MKYCPYCGTGLQDEMVFCPLCGKRYISSYILYEAHDYYEAYTKFQALADKGYAPAKRDLEPLREMIYYTMQDAAGRI